MKKLIVYTLYSILYTLYFAPFNHAHASTDPQNATVSATATVLSIPATTSDTSAPTPPILVAPTDGQVTNNPKPEFRWKQSTDSDSNTIYYTLHLNNVANYLGISNNGNSQKYNYVATIGDNHVFLNPTLDLPEGEYNWFVVASDLSGNKSYSTTWHFTIDRTPPILILDNIDEQYQDPDLSTPDPIFDIRGPKDVYLTILTEPWATVTIKLDNASYSYPTNAQGRTTPYFHLTPGSYLVDISSFDQAGLTSTLPTFTLVITESGSIPSTIPTAPSSSYKLPSNLSYLPSTIYELIAPTRFSLTNAIYALLALILDILLIVLWYRRPNILILDRYTNKPIRSAIVYHSRPTTKFRGTNILATRRSPLLYELFRNNRGLLHISRLSRYSTLTIRVGETTHLLSLSVAKSFYTILI